MIAEFSLDDGRKVRLDFHYNPDAFLFRHGLGRGIRPTCSYCMVERDAQMINPGNPESDTLLPGWAILDSPEPGTLSLSCPAHTSDNPELHAEIVKRFRLIMQPRFVHLSRACYAAWKADDSAHPGMIVREPRNSPSTAL